jgi:hypothetical protein
MLQSIHRKRSETYIKSLRESVDEQLVWLLLLRSMDSTVLSSPFNLKLKLSLSQEYAWE